jgi:hypothetical protein
MFKYLKGLFSRKNSRNMEFREEGGFLSIDINLEDLAYKRCSML